MYLERLPLRQSHCNGAEGDSLFLYHFGIWKSPKSNFLRQLVGSHDQSLIACKAAARLKPCCGPTRQMVSWQCAQRSALRSVQHQIRPTGADRRWQRQRLRAGWCAACLFPHGDAGRRSSGPAWRRPCKFAAIPADPAARPAPEMDDPRIGRHPRRNAKGAVSPQHTQAHVWSQRSHALVGDMFLGDMAQPAGTKIGQE